MDAIDILGSLLGHKSSRPGRGTDVLTDILSGRSRSRPSTRSGSSEPVDIESEAKKLEDLLKVAKGRHAGRGTERREPPSRAGAPPSHRSGYGESRSSDDRRDDTVSANDRALVLVRAMVNAAKSDGQVSQDEQQKILERLGGQSREAIQFLREELAKPLDVREFAQSVPLGMEQQAYTMSLIAIDLDTGREAKYLVELAQALRIPLEVREQIHQRLGAPSVY
jgi:hypothetical protein